ncbi:hypothetical protein D9757_013135 [Collybiopsis confluens]|uniref:Uncharacterized protein n=1 Tax=Collybiopsis confluens TaxID=2823264 RepID=A0A8H5GT01_9AGAR|nr:hypothetical protein D9757_013214 [Collybiopsis confluens]KAF5370409.1 hypothetical protein D9757_013135 [Collybiopsis confluens]
MSHVRNLQPHSQPYPLCGGFLLTQEEACLFLRRDPSAPDANVSIVALDLQDILNPKNLMVELVTWPEFSYSDDPKDTSYILPTRAANFSELQFSIIGNKYAGLPQFDAREREQVVIKRLEELGLEMKNPKFITVYKHEQAISQVPPVPSWVQAPWPPPYTRRVVRRSNAQATAQMA